jgi:phage tail-like protein
VALNPRTIGNLAAGLFNIRGDSSKFRVVIDHGDYDLGAWSKVSGLGVSWDPCEYRHGGDNSLWTIPGRSKYNKITLTRATCPDSEVVQEWLANTSKYPKAYSGYIRLLTAIGYPLVTWTFGALIPVGWKIADFDTKASTVVLETLEIAHTGFLEDHVSRPAPLSNALSGLLS